MMAVSKPGNATKIAFFPVIDTLDPRGALETDDEGGAFLLQASGVAKGVDLSRHVLLDEPE